MSRRIFIKAEDIWRKRQFWYADHYQKREMAKAYSMEQAIRTLRACAQMPEPRLEIDGHLETGTYNAERAIPICDQLQLLQESGTPAELFVKWYWSDEEWQSFMDQFNALPEPEPLYEIVEVNGHPELKVVPYILGTNGVRAGYKPAVVRNSGQK